jgi:hypothetical protein
VPSAKRTVLAVTRRGRPARRPIIVLTAKDDRMKLDQILLPVRDNRGRKFKRSLYSKLHRELVEHFGGLTAHARSVD